MSKDAEISILLECAEKLGRDSYCQAWLLDQIPFIQRDIRNDIIPQIGWAETRKLEQGAIDLANQQAKRIIEDRKSTRLNSSHVSESRMPSSA